MVLTSDSETSQLAIAMVGGFWYRSAINNGVNAGTLSRFRWMKSGVDIPLQATRMILYRN